MNTAKLTPKQKDLERRYAVMMALVMKNGFITNAQAAHIGGSRQRSQGYFYLNKLRQRGLLKHVEHNAWARNKRCPGCGIFPVSYTDCDCLEN